MVAAAIIGGAVIGGAISAKGAKDAANTQAEAAQNATNASVSEQRREYDTNNQLLAPWREAGQGALSRLTAASTGDMSGFYKDPSYEWTRAQGERGVLQSAAARGGMMSGNALKALTDYNQNLASTQYGNWWNRQAGLAGIGQTATNATVNSNSNSANNISNSLMQGGLASGDARASGIMGGANSWSNAINGGLNNWMLYRGGYFNGPSGYSPAAGSVGSASYVSPSFSGWTE